MSLRDSPEVVSPEERRQSLLHHYSKSRIGVCVDKGVNNTVQDPKERQSTGQVEDIRNQSYGEKKYNESS